MKLPIEIEYAFKELEDNGYISVILSRDEIQKIIDCLEKIDGETELSADLKLVLRGLL